MANLIPTTDYNTTVSGGVITVTASGLAKLKVGWPIQYIYTDTGKRFFAKVSAINGFAVSLSGPALVNSNVFSSIGVGTLKAPVYGSAPTSIILVDDTWSTGVRNVQNLPTRSAWFASGSPVPISVVTSTLTITPHQFARQWTTYFAPSPVTLTNGQTLQWTLKLTPHSITANVLRNFKLGLFDWSSSTRRTSDGTPNGTNAKGFAMMINMAATSGITPSLRVYRRNNLTLADVLNDPADFISLGFGGVSGDPVFVDNALHSLVMTIKRNSSSSTDVTATLYNASNAVVVTATGNDANSPAYSSFDTLLIRTPTANTTAASIDFTEHKVEQKLF